MPNFYFRTGPFDDTPPAQISLDQGALNGNANPWAVFLGMPSAVSNVADPWNPQELVGDPYTPILTHSDDWQYASIDCAKIIADCRAACLGLYVNSLDLFARVGIGQSW
jgi:hypothetical protein